MASAKQLLIEALSVKPINILYLRQICLDYPGVIASAGTRVRVWSLLLIGTSTQPSSASSFNNSSSRGSNTSSSHNSTNCSNSQKTKSATVATTTVTKPNKDLLIPDKECDEQHVLEADVKRTRAEIEEFRTTSYRNNILIILQTFCLKHNIQYKQGMNEVLAPFLFIQPPPQYPSSLPFALFEAFLFRYLERYFCVDDSSYLFKSFRYFQILLSFHDPQLANHLSENDFYPELYAPQWFLTFYSRALPMKYVLRLWDMIIAVDDTAFMFFIGLCLLRRRRNELLSNNHEMIPEIISIPLGQSFTSKNDVDTIMSESLTAYRQTPRTFLRHLRLCCVSRVELNHSVPTHIPLTVINNNSTTRMDNANTANSNHNNCATSISNNSIDCHQSLQQHSQQQQLHRQCDIAMAEQSVRSTVMISAQELLTHIAPIIANENNNINNQPKLTSPPLSSRSTTSTSNNYNNMDNTLTTETIIDNNTDISMNESLLTKLPSAFFTSSSPSLSLSSSSVPQAQYIVIDVRTTKEIKLMGGCLLPRAISLEPTVFLHQPEVFDAWLQHFDNVKSTCHICIIDMPLSTSKRLITSDEAGTSLWRRLLLGEGDGDNNNSSNDNDGSNDESRFKQQSLRQNTSSSSGKFRNHHNTNSSYNSNYNNINVSSINSTKNHISIINNNNNNNYNNNNIDTQSPFYEYEQCAAVDDTHRVAVKLAQALRTAHFPYVCILQGSLPAFIQQLMLSRGSVEPVVINHNDDVFNQYLSKNGLTESNSVFSSKNPNTSSSSGSVNNNNTRDHSKYNTCNIKRNNSSKPATTVNAVDDDTARWMKMMNINNISINDNSVSSSNNNNNQDKMNNITSENGLFYIGGDIITSYIQSVSSSSLSTSSQPTIPIEIGSIDKRYVIAHKVASELGHVNMEKYLKQRIITTTVTTNTFS